MNYTKLLSNIVDIYIHICNSLLTYNMSELELAVCGCYQWCKTLREKASQRL